MTSNDSKPMPTQPPKGGSGVSRRPPTVIEVHHFDMENHAASFNQGYETAMTQHLAPDPTAADDWLAEHDAVAKADALEQAAASFDFPDGRWYPAEYETLNKVRKVLRTRAATELRPYRTTTEAAPHA